MSISTKLYGDIKMSLTKSDVAAKKDSAASLTVRSTRKKSGYNKLPAADAGPLDYNGCPLCYGRRPNAETIAAIEDAVHNRGKYKVHKNARDLFKDFD